MTTTVTLSPVQINEQVRELRRQFEETRRQHDEAEREGREIDRQIRDLQAQCQHKKTEKRLMQDVAEMKLRRFCTDCGAQA